jgi:outer membrane receptor protein involved in Fe transport
VLLAVKPASADVFGRLHVSVKNVDDSKPIAGATITFHDPANVKGDLTLSTNAAGSVTSPLLETRAWEVTAAAPKYATIRKEVRVSPDSVTELAFELEPVETTIKITSERSILKPSDASTVSTRPREFAAAIPVTAQNPQQLTGVLTSNPGFVQDSANQVHPRGEHSATSIYIQGFQLGGAAQGRFGPIINPDALENLDIMTGAFPPEYAGDSAVLNTTVRSGTITPFATIEAGGGNYRTGVGSFAIGGQTGFADDVGESQSAPKILSYFLSGSLRGTANALESPQPQDQTAHNRGSADTLLGKFDLTPDHSDVFSLIVNGAPARTQVANRTGLPAKYANVGQGFGFGGALSEAAAAAQGILSQDAAGQDIFQKDQNAFGVLQWRHEFDDQLSSLLSFGLDQSKLDTLNNNPGIDLNNLPDDNSIEYNPTVRRTADHKQVAASLTWSNADHTVKAGAQYVDETAQDSYQLVPASQLAVDALFAADSRLVPEGTPEVAADGKPVTDAQGNQVYHVNQGATSPRLPVHSDGYYTAGYVQDTWKAFEHFTANYGLRLDAYKQHQNLGQDNVEEDQFSPRVNLAYGFYPTWVGRASYNRIFIEPPLSQGAIIGEPIRPERLNQYEVSLEKEVTPRQKAKVSFYEKFIKNQVDTGLLIPSTQLGLFTSVNFDRDHVHGAEVSYDLLADHNFGTSAFVAYSYSVAQPSGFDNAGAPVPKYNDHDQRHTLSGGAAYTFDNGASVGADAYYGSGVASSVVTDNGPRKQNSRVDLSATSPKFIFGKGGLKLTVANLFDERDLLNFNSGFSGTRFQQARTVLLSTYFAF